VRRSRTALIGLVALASCSACGGKTEDTTPPPDTSGKDCGTRTFTSADFHGAVGALIAATHASNDTAASTRSDIDRDVRGIATTFQVTPESGSEQIGMSKLVTAIQLYFAGVTQNTLQTTVSPLTCAPNEAIADAAEKRCLAEEGCDTSGADCPESELCKEMGRLNGLASPTCAGPVIDATFDFAPTTTEFDRAEAYTRIGELKSRGASILGSYARLSSIITGEVNGEVIYDPSPLVQMEDAYQQILSSGENTWRLNLSPACKAYALPALTAQVALVGDLATDSSGALGEGKQFATLF
jgi:hypothetical protein